MSEHVPDIQDLMATAARVAAEVQGLRADLADKASNTDMEGKADKKTVRRSGRRTWRVLFFDVALSLVGLALWYSQVQTNHRLETSLHQNYATSQQQQETRTRVLCPLYTVLLAATLNPTPRVADTPAQRLQFEMAVGTIRAGYATLGCTPALPPASPAAPG